jgi:hypothetical protein
MTKTILILIMIVSVSLLIVGCGSNNEPADIEITPDPALEEPEVVVEEGLSEKESYAKFEATFACMLVEASTSEDPNAITDVLTNYKPMAEERGYTAKQLETYITEYENDDEFKQMGLKYMQEICPELLDQVSQE